MAMPLKLHEYYLFVRWIATPSMFRDPPLQKDFEKVHNVSCQTIANWKHDPNFRVDVRREILNWGRDHSADVVAGLWRDAVKNGGASAKIWLDYFEGMGPNSPEGLSNPADAIPIEADKKRLILAAFSNYGILSNKPDVNVDQQNSRGNTSQPGAAP